MTKGKNLETDYFLREDKANKHKLAQKNRRKQKKEHDDELKKLHFNKCPKCGHDLEEKRMSYFDVDQCSSCGVLVLEADDIDKFIAEERSILKSLIDFFKS